METTKTYDFKGQVYTRIPEDVVKRLGIDAGDEITFETAGDGVLMKPVKQGVMSPEELAALKKIGAIRYNERTLERVKSEIKGYEKAFESLFLRKILFEYTKEGKKLIGIGREYFPYVTGNAAPSSIAIENPMVEKLFGEGFVVLDEERAASDLNDKLVEMKKIEEVIGIRGFDKKYYIITNAKYSELYSKFNTALKSEKSSAQLVDELKIAEGLVHAVIEVMKENGDIIERKKDTFQVV